MSFEIRGRRIGAREPLFTIAELGLNHGGSIETALALVDAAATAGASAVKIQLFRADELIASGAPAPAHVQATSLRAFFRRFELDADACRAIRSRAYGRGLAFVATPFSYAAVELLETIGVDAYKIASGDITYAGLLGRCARTRKPIVMSTGMAELREVRDAVAAVRAAGGGPLAVLHCVSAYPVPAGAENLAAIATLRRALRTEVGLSDHSPDGSAVPVAVALGASLYERHLRLPGDDGVDAAVSSTPDEFAALVRAAAHTRRTLGDGRKVCQPAEAVNAIPSRRSLVASRRIAAGDTVAADDIIALRPGVGLSPALEHRLIGTVIARTIEAGEPFLERDLAPEGGRRAVA